MPAAKKTIGLAFDVEEVPSSWRLEEANVPETPLHGAIIELLMLILKHHSEGRSALVCSNLGCRWDPDDMRVGTDPDVVLIEPRPPEGELLSTLNVWREGHAPPRVAVEVVSRTNPDKDYIEAPLRCARLGARELWVFDPHRVGPSTTGGPFLLQVWRRVETDEGPKMKRTYAGGGPGYSDELGAWLVGTENPTRLRIAAGPSGPFWPTATEAERDRAEAAEAELERLRRLLDSK